MEAGFDEFELTVGREPQGELCGHGLNGLFRAIVQ